MAEVARLYPSAPSGIPAHLAKPGLRYRLQVAQVLLALVLFLLIYLALLAVAFGLMVWVLWPPEEQAVSPEAWTAGLFLIAVRISILILALMLFAFLLKGFFKRGHADTSQDLEVSEREQPELFQFIRSLCAEIGCRTPTRVQLSPDVNAAVVYSTSILNLIVPPKKTLLIGLGLVNGLNLVEFKALLAHELGHFSQRTLRVDGYVSVAYQVIDNMVNVRDRWDNWIIRRAGIPWVSIFAVPLYGMAELIRALLKAAFRVLHAAHLSMRRQMELNADLVAVGAAGSDAPVQLLFKGDFYQACLQQSSRDLALGAELGLLSRDLFLHQERAGHWLRAASRNPDLGRVPDPSSSVTVFQPGDTSPLAMWADHPSHYDRERNAKQRYFQSPQDDRSAWLLFRDPQAVREQVTREFYRTCLNREPDESRMDPESVQAFIDEEHAEAVFDPRYQGIYDGRHLELPILVQLAPEASSTAAPDPDQLSASLRELYPAEPPFWVVEYRRRRDEFDLLKNHCTGRVKLEGEEFEFRGQRRPIAEAEDLLMEVHGELERDRRFLEQFDRSVFDLHGQLARQLGREKEFEQRYRFHLAVEHLLRTAWDRNAQVEAICHFVQNSTQIPWEQVNELEEALAQAHEWIAAVIRQAGQMLLPTLKHLKAGQPLASLLPQEPDPPSLRSSESYVDLNLGPLTEFHVRLGMLLDRLTWIQVKSLAGILNLQEQLASQWSEQAQTAC